MTIEHLTIENFITPNGQYAVNHDSGNNWTIEYNTIQNITSPGPSTSEPGGAAVGTGNNNVLEYNCLTNNGEYGLNSGGNNVTVSYNEISDNGAADFPDNDCGCSGGAKFWDAEDNTVTNNYVHNNYDVGLWADTDNAGFLFQDNYISDNWAQGILYEISYNADITDNTFVANGWGSGSTCQGCGTPVWGAAIWLSNSGGLSGTGSTYDGVLEVSNNVFTDNWDGLIVVQDADRTCGSGANASTGYCTLNNPSVFTTSSCAANYPNSTGPNQTPDYYDGCQWKAQNITASDNTFNFNAADINSDAGGLSFPNDGGTWDPQACPTSNLTNTGSTNSSWCGFNGMFGFPGSLPPVGDTLVVPTAIMNLPDSNGEPSDNNHWTGNTYNGTQYFQAYDQGVATYNGYQCTDTLAQWQSDWGQD